MAVDMFLKLDSVEGEATDDKHKGEIDVLSWTWAVSQTGTSGKGGGSGAGKAEHKDLEIRKLVDRASPVLYFKCASGEHIKSADLVVRKAGGEALEYMKIHLDDLIVTSFEMGGQPEADQLTEVVRLNFSKSLVTYSPQSSSGGGSGDVSGGWDLALNKRNG